MRSLVFAIIAVVLLVPGYGRAGRADDLADCKSAVPERAIPGCTRLLDSGSLTRRDQAKAYNSRGVAYRRNGQDDRAIEDFNKAIEIRPTFVGAYNNRAYSYNNKREYDRAIADASTAIKLNPKLWQLYLNRAISYVGIGQYGKAIADNTMAIELNPEYAMGYNNRGYAYMLDGRLEEALADFERASGLDPKNPRVHHSLGEAYFRSGDPNRAMETWTDACRLASKAIAEEWQRRLAAVGYFTGAVDGVCGDSLIEAFRECARAKCVF